MVSSTTEGTAEEHSDWQPSVNPWLVAASVMLATFMVVLDSSVATVALPHIAGSLSASTDESTWVLTSYLVANAIMLPAAGWIARRIGRKRLLIISILAFTGASLLCGMAVDMPMLIAARVLQGIGGGGMQPLAQSILLESFPPRKHGTAMAVYGMGMVVAPVIGPTLGGWITDSYSWRWIFYINLPVGILALFMANLFIEDPPYLRHEFKVAIDYLGFGLMAVWLGSNATGSGQRTGGGLVRGQLDSRGNRGVRGRVRGLRRARAHEPGTDRPASHSAQPQLRHGHAHRHALRLRALWRHGSAAAVSANPAGLLGAGQRPGREPARPGFPHRHDGGWNPR